MKKKILAVVLAVTLVASMGTLAFASPSPAGIELTGVTDPPVIPPDNDTGFPPSVRGLADGLDFGSITVASVNTASSNVVRNSLTHARTAPQEEIGIRTTSAVNFNVQATLTGFQVGTVNTLPGAFMNFTATGATAVVPGGTAGGFARADGGWQSLPLSSPHTFTVTTNNLMSGTGATPGSAVTVIEGRNFTNVPMRWARNLVGELTILPNSALTAGETLATMTWTVAAA